MSMMTVQSPPTLLAQEVLAQEAQEVIIISPVRVDKYRNFKACYFAALKVGGVPQSLQNQGSVDDGHVSLMTLNENHQAIDVLGGKLNPL